MMNKTDIYNIKPKSWPYQEIDEHGFITYSETPGENWYVSTKNCRVNYIKVMYYDEHENGIRFANFNGHVRILSKSLTFCSANSLAYCNPLF